MNRVFRIAAPYRVPDGTLISGFLNCKDNNSGLPFDLLEGMSIAAGTIEPGTRSKLHVMPFVTQVTFVRRGNLLVKMKAPQDSQPYALRLTPDEAVVTLPHTLFQLINDGSEPCEVLYIVSPAYVFETSADGVRYDDAVVLNEDWDALAASRWEISAPMPSMEQRRQAEHRLSQAQCAHHCANA